MDIVAIIPTESVEELEAKGHTTVVVDPTFS